MNRPRARHDALPRAGVREEMLRELRGLALGDHPPDDIEAEEVDDEVEA